MTDEEDDEEAESCALMAIKQSSFLVHCAKALTLESNCEAISVITRGLYFIL